MPNRFIQKSLIYHTTYHFKKHLCLPTCSSMPEAGKAKGTVDLICFGIGVMKVISWRQLFPEEKKKPLQKTLKANRAASPPKQMSLVLGQPSLWLWSRRSSFKNSGSFSKLAPKPFHSTVRQSFFPGARRPTGGRGAFFWHTHSSPPPPLFPLQPTEKWSWRGVWSRKGLAQSRGG